MVHISHFHLLPSFDFQISHFKSQISGFKFPASNFNLLDSFWSLSTFGVGGKSQKLIIGQVKLERIIFFLNNRWIKKYKQMKQ